MTMSPLTASFVLHFGEMGSRWGFNRTVGQIFALLVLTEESLTANELAEALGVSRGNVSMAIKELQSWRLVKVQHKPGDRKEYYLPAGDIWYMAKTVAEERRKREIDPTLSVVRDILLETPASDEDRYAQGRVQEIHDLLESFMSWANELEGMSQEKLETLMKLGTRVGKVLDLTEKLKP